MIYKRRKPTNFSGKSLEDELIKEINYVKASKRPVSLYELKKICKKYLKSEFAITWLEEIDNYTELDALASMLRRKDSPEKEVGELLYFYAGMRSIYERESSYNTPKTCKHCYRFSGDSGYCSLHDRKTNEAGNRHGRRIQKNYWEEINKLRKTQRSASYPPYCGKALVKWMQRFVPNVLAISENIDSKLCLVEVFKCLDDPSSDKEGVLERKVEYQRMAGMAELNSDFKDLYQEIGKVYLFRAEAWLLAISKRKWGGARPEAGRKKFI
ncbi:hypothetical protein ACFL48_05015 [Pseudomonadota bacterium]